MASYDEVIPPGQAGKVTATVKTENYRGPVEKSITVTTNDAKQPTFQLRIKATITGSVVLLPGHGLSFPSGANWNYSGRLLIRKDETETGGLKISDVTSSAPWLRASARRVEEVEPAAQGLPEARPGDYILDVSVDGAPPKGQPSQRVKFKTSLTREPEVTVPVSVVVPAGLTVVPSTITLAQPKPGEEATGALTATIRPGLEKEKLEAVASPDAFQVKLEPVGPRRYKAIVSWNPNAEAAATQGTIIFRLGKEESVTVLVRVGQAHASAAATRPVGSTSP